MKSVLVLFTSALVAAAGVGCGEAPAPVAPVVSPFVTQFSGLWSGAMQLTSVSGGECVGPDFAAQTGAIDEGTITITQDGSDVSAVVRSTTSGLTCSYAGNGSPTTFALSAVSCNGAQILHQCANGQARVLELVGSTMTGVVSAGVTSGNITTSYNVFADSTEEIARRPIAGLTLQYRFSASRR